MRQEPYRTVIWGPGVMGSAMIREISKRPEYRIVGALCYSSEKSGRDVGEIAGIGMRADQFEQASAMLEKVWSPLSASEIGFMALKLHDADPSRVKVEYQAHCDFATAPCAVPDLFIVETDEALCVHQTYNGSVDGEPFMSMNLHWKSDYRTLSK